MRLLRIVLENFRGIDQRDIEFAADGITVVEGPNEIGKSSIPEALALIRAFKDSSQARQVQNVRPTHRDADPHVEIEVVAGRHHFTYAKTWSRRGRTELTVHSPKAESLTGDLAHERALAIFAETVDEQLWDALVQVQGESLQQPVLARIEPLSAALAALGGSSAAEDTHTDLMDRIESAYLTWYTPTGKPTGELAQLTSELASARADLVSCREALSRADALVERHERLVVERAGLLDQLAIAAKDVVTYREQSDALDQLRDERREAASVLQVAEQALASARLAAERRDELVAEWREAFDDHHRLGADLSGAEESLAEAEAKVAVADAAAADAMARVESARALAAERTALVDAAGQAAELSALERRITTAERCTSELVSLESALAELRIDAAALRRITDAHVAWQSAHAVASAGAARLSVEVLGTHEVLVDGQLSAGVDTEVVRPTVIEVDEVVRVVLTPDAAAHDRSREVDRLRDELDHLLESYGVADLEAARDAAELRAELSRRAGSMKAELDATVDGATIPVLAARAALLRDRLGETAPCAEDLDLLRAHARDAERALATEVSAAAVAREERDALHQIASDLRDQVLGARPRLDAVSDRLQRAEHRLAAARAESDDETVRADLVEATSAVESAERVLAELDRDLRDAGADSIEILLTAAEDGVRTIERQVAERSTALTQVEAQLELLGGEGLQDALNLAEEREQDCARRHRSVQARAEAALLLRTTMRDRSAAARRSYVEPFQSAITELGRTVFGPTFQVQVDDDLAIESRTLDGCTVDFSSLSGGAREQLSILGRVATARLVAADDGVPVILDDTMGFSDPVRRQRMNAMFTMVAREESTQIIILTCDASRFASLGCARSVRLS